MVKSYEEKIAKLKNHIEALEKGYDNVILILNDDLETDKESGEITLKDDKKKVFVESVGKSAEIADSIFARITDKKKELEDLENSDKPQKEREQKIEQEKPKKASTRNLKDH